MSIYGNKIFTREEEAWTGNVARMEECRRGLKILKSTPAGKRPLGKLRRRWEDNIRMDLLKNRYQYEELG